jgi:hypothetical protein
MKILVIFLLPVVVLSCGIRIQKNNSSLNQIVNEKISIKLDSLSRINSFGLKAIFYDTAYLNFFLGCSGHYDIPRIQINLSLKSETEKINPNLFRLQKLDTNFWIKLYEVEQYNAEIDSIITSKFYERFINSDIDRMTPEEDDFYSSLLLQYPEKSLTARIVVDIFFIDDKIYLNYVWILKSNIKYYDIRFLKAHRQSLGIGQISFDLKNGDLMDDLFIICR